MTPSTSGICSACSAAAVVGGVCGRCGNVAGEANRCPHCHAIARVEPKGAGVSLRWVCGVCGGPRMPHGLGGEAAAQPLREAKASQSRALRARATFWLFAMMATFFTMVAVAAWPAALIVKLVLLVMAVAPTFMAVRARSRASSATADGNEALDRAWLAAAEDVASHAKQGVTVAELAKRLQIDPVKAEKLLTQLAVHERTRIDVDDDAEVRYSVTPDIDTSKGPHLRVDPVEDQFRALEEAELDEAQAKKLATPAFPRGSGR